MADYAISSRADHDLVDIYAYTYQVFGEQQAERYTRDLHARFQLLADFPGIGLPAKIGNRVCLKFPTGSHVIYYERADAGVLIGRILHGAQDPTRHALDA